MTETPVTPEIVQVLACLNMRGGCVIGGSHDVLLKSTSFLLCIYSTFVMLYSNTDDDDDDDGLRRPCCTACPCEQV